MNDRLGFKKRCLFPVTRPSLGNGPDPRLFLFIFYINHPKTLFLQFLTFFFKPDFPPILPTKSPLAKKPKKTADRPTLTFLGMLQERSFHSGLAPHFWSFKFA